MEAIVLAGGLGTRLRAVVSDLPKPMAPVAGRPFLAILLDQLDQAGFEHVVLSVGYRREAIMEHFGDRYGRLALSYAVETHPLGTGGAIRLALEQTQAPELFVLNGDTYLALDYSAMLAHHRRHGARLTLAAQQVADTHRYGALALQGDRVIDFLEKGRSGPGLINGGTYLLEPGLFDDQALPEAFSFETDLLMPKVAELAPLAFITEGRFIDIGVPEDYARAQTLFATP